MPKEFGLGERREGSVDSLISSLDMGYKKRNGDKLYLAQQTGIVFGQVEFAIKGSTIVGPDGTEFDLAQMAYPEIYWYLEKCQKGASTDVNKDPEEDFN
jgi:hypothetical protein